MLSLLRWLGVRHWLHHPVRAALTVLGVALGVAVTLSVRMIGTEILGAHHRSLERIAGRAQLSVRAGDAGMSRDMVDRVAGVDGVAHVEPLLEKVILEPGRGPVLLLGIDFLIDGALRDLEAVEGDEEVLDDPIAFLNSTESVVVPESFARARGLRKGSRFDLVASVGRRTFEIRGLLRDQGPVKSFGGDVVVMFLDAAQVALELDQSITRVDLSVAEGRTPAELKERLTRELGDAYEVDYPLSRGARLEQMIQGMTEALALMVALALWVGTLLAYNAVEIGVRQRQRELATLRALGASRAAVVGQVLAEAVLLGLLATAVGVALGAAMARGGVTQTAATVSAVYQVVKVDDVRVGPPEVLAGIVVGLLVPLLAALRPALWVARQPPHLGLSRPPEELHGGGSRSGAAAGIAFTLAGVALFLLPQARESHHVGQAGFGLTLVGALFLAPAIVTLAAHATHRLLGARLSAEASVAVDHVVRDRRRAALNVASLVAGVATVITIATYVHSLKVTYRGWLESAAPADLFVTAGAAFGVSKNVPLKEEIGELFRQLPEVEDMLHVRLVDITHLDRPVKLLSLESTDYLRLAQPILLEGRRRTGPYPLDHVYVSENLARRGGYRPGSPIEIRTPSGPRRFTVDCVMMDFTSDHGLVVMDREAYREAFRDDLVDTFDLFLAEGADVEAVQEAIRSRWGETYDLFVLTSSEFKGEALKLIDQFFELLRLIQMVTLVIAVLGVTTTLVASVLDRLQEVGLMRAVGSTPGQIVRITLTEAGFIGGFSSVLGCVLGSFTGALFLRSVIVAATGWDLPYRFPYQVVGPTILAVTLASVLSGLYPALWVARQPTLAAMREE